jgi:hypothetical protein
VGTSRYRSFPPSPRSCLRRRFYPPVALVVIIAGSAELTAGLFCLTSSLGGLGMLAIGIVMIAVSLIVLWLCLPKGGEPKPWMLRAGIEIVVSIFIVSTLGLGLIAFAAGI